MPPAKAADDPFAPVPATPRAAPASRPAAPPADESDDPFAPARPAPRGAAPAAVTPAEDDPFAPIPARPASIPLSEDLLLDAGGQLPTRHWTDNSGQFQVRGRLILILEGKIRLLKETGRTTTVALERLSTADRRYVEQVTAAYGSDLADALVAAR